MAKIIKGMDTAERIGIELKEQVEQLAHEKITPVLTIVRAGDDKSQISYEQGAAKRCAKAGIEVRNMTFPSEIPGEELILKIRELNEDSSVHGILIMRPLPY